MTYIEYSENDGCISSTMSHLTAITHNNSLGALYAPISVVWPQWCVQRTLHL
jgi:hypothetical protein